jgi:Gas vesicle synthesis protein GvpL/GvpF
VTGVYLYGLASASERIDIEVPGVGGPDAPVRRVVHGELAALVSEIEIGPLTAARDLRAHWRVLEEAASNATVLPVRFGTILENDDALVAEFMAPRHDRLVAQLAELSGKVQLNVKCFYDEDQLLRNVVRDSPSIARLNERVRGKPEAATYYERIQLGELVAAEVGQARARDAALVIGRLEPLAVAARNEAPSTSDSAVNAAFLVERAKLDQFSAAVTALTAEVEDRMRLRFIGPLPPYSFAEEETAAWA